MKIVGENRQNQHQGDGQGNDLGDPVGAALCLPDAMGRKIAEESHGEQRQVVAIPAIPGQGDIPG